MKHLRTYVIVFLVLASFNLVRAEENVAPAVESSPAPAPEEVTTAADPSAVDRTPASLGTATAPEEKPSVVPSIALVSEKAKHKRWKNNGLRKVKSACEVMDNPDGKKIGMLKLERKLWTDEIDNEAWYKVTRKSGPGFVKKECFEQASK